MTEIFLAREALGDGLRRRELRRFYRAVFRGVYTPKWVTLTLNDRAFGAWLATDRTGVIAGVVASAMHGADWVDTGEQIEVTQKKTVKQSTTDPESGNFHKGEHEECFAYEHQTFCDGNGFVVAFDTVPGNVHDSVSFFPAYEKLLEKYSSEIENVCLDSGYKTPAIAREIMENGQTPYFPYKRPMTKEGFFKKYEYV